MKNLVAIVAVIGIALAAGAWADPNCSALDYSCAEEGDECVGDLFYNSADCYNNSKCCAFPLYCINGTCMEDTRDKECKDVSDCRAALYGSGIIACIKNKCVVQGSFNDSCTKDDHCSGDQVCDKNLCSGLNISSKCDPATPGANYQCGTNLTCVKGVCVTPVPVGEACTSDAECDIYSMCNDGKCIEPWTLKSNETCVRDDACEIGLYCDRTEKKCKETVPAQYVVCQTDSDCLEYGNTSVCNQCNSETGEMYCSDPVNVERDCIAEKAAALKCYRKNGCAPALSFSLDTCAMLECTAETNAIFTCRSMCEDLKRVSGARCLAGIMLRYCPLLPTWARITIAFGVLVAIIVVVFVSYGIFRCCNKTKKEGYQEVSGTPQ